MVYGDAPRPTGLSLGLPARVCQGTDRPPGDTAGAAGHWRAGSATRGLPSVLSKAQASLSEPPRWEPRLEF